jgi:hypothetical protein
LWKAKDSRVTRYDLVDLRKVLSDSAYHSPERSPERPTVDAASASKTETIKVYDIAERSDEASKNVCMITTKFPIF